VLNKIPIEKRKPENQAIKDAKTQGRKYKVQKDKLESMISENLDSTNKCNKN
jgi:hypothetical protein